MTYLDILEQSYAAQQMIKGGFAMKKIFVLATVVVSTIVLMLSIGVNFAQAAEKMMDKDMMMKPGDMMMEKGQMMMIKARRWGEA